MSTALVVGCGEVGRALVQVLTSAHEVFMIDKDRGIDARGMARNVDVMHVCFPYSDGFVDAVDVYDQEYQPKHLIIHSTVPVGTSVRCSASHSPVIGLHPNLVQSLRTFTKFIGGPDSGPAAEHLRRAGMRVYVFDKAETCELMKLMSTLYYATCIEFTKDVKRMCGDAGVPFEAWTLWTDNYNAGYQALGRAEYTRPNLTHIPGTIGGHCLLPNADLLDGDFAELVRRRNEDDD